MDASHLSREQAQAEAVRLAAALVAGRGLPLIGAGPASRLLDEQAGTPARWRVLFENVAAGGRAYEGAVGVLVDLDRGAAEFKPGRA